MIAPVQTPAVAIEAVVDPPPAPIETMVDHVAPVAQAVSETMVTMTVGAVGPVVEAALDPVAVAVEAVLDAIAPAIETVLGAAAVIDPAVSQGRARTQGQQQQSGKRAFHQASPVVGSGLTRYNAGRRARLTRSQQTGFARRARLPDNIESATA